MTDAPSRQQDTTPNPAAVAMCDYEALPESLRGGARRYIEQNIEPGGFLSAVICNDLKEAFGRADEGNRAALFEIVCWFYNKAPASCWGSPERFEKWLEQGRLARLRDVTE